MAGHLLWKDSHRTKNASVPVTCQGPDVARCPQIRRGPEPLRQLLGKGTLLVQKLKYLVENRAGRIKREWLPTLRWTDMEFIHVASGGWRRRIQIFPEQ